MRLRAHRRAFSLVELIVVMLIIGMLASLAIPRLSRGSEGALEASVHEDLRVVRQALILYAAEHNNVFPGPEADSAAGQLTQYSDLKGNTSSKRTGAYVYGPYLVAVPPCPIGPNAGSRDILIDDTNSPPEPNPGSGDGWVYNPKTGEFLPNINESFEAGDNIIIDGGGVTILKGGS
jgi:general secretion pathway protein G